ncbi:hypothethical protein [Ralstonia solanacearum PSI07]|uniref:Uncharacterized protein n=1 Tax=blood disease bacterium R229 TaxID=741978 RepID=G2ZP78_9RALS|nr:hypothethical protein [Ralstonia solanacearum PSI07]CCA80864.1 conserved hypothetical protein [blood disease bacterium R229]
MSSLCPSAAHPDTLSTATAHTHPIQKLATRRSMAFQPFSAASVRPRGAAFVADDLRQR